MTGVGGSHLKHCGSRPAIFTLIMDDSILFRAKLFLVLVLFKLTIENTLSASASEWGSHSSLCRNPYPCHQGINMCTKNRKKNEMCTLSLSLSLSLSLTHTHTHTHTHSLMYMLRASSAILLCMCSMCIEHCFSVGMFGAKFIFYFWYF